MEVLSSCSGEPLDIAIGGENGIALDFSWTKLDGSTYNLRPEDRPDIVTRVFKLKIDKVIEMILDSPTDTWCIPVVGGPVNLPVLRGCVLNIWRHWVNVGKAAIPTPDVLPVPQVSK